MPNIQDVLQKVIDFTGRRAGILRLDEETDSDRPIRVSIGVLATDHTGFASFDLTRISRTYSEPTPIPSLQVALSAVPVRYNVSSVMYYGLLQSNRIDILASSRLKNDSILSIVEVPKAFKERQSALSLPALQNPHLIDWRLSLGSFAAIPQNTIGVDGCETFTPANFATTEFPLRQVQRLIPVANDGIEPLNDDFPSALVAEYMVRLKPIGHSLGHVVYSCPLAPGESVRLAVIDWRRNDLGIRGEITVERNP